METFSALLAICARNSPATGEFPAQRPVTRSFDVFFDLRLNKRLSKQLWRWWFPGEFPAQMACIAENVSIWWRHHDIGTFWKLCCHNLFFWFFLTIYITPGRLMKTTTVVFISLPGVIHVAVWAVEFLCDDDRSHRQQRLSLLFGKWSQLMISVFIAALSLLWRHNGYHGVSNHQPHDRLLNRPFRSQSKETSKPLRHWPLCGEFTGDRWIPRTNGQ